MFVRLSVIAALALGLGCKDRSPALDLSSVDRSDGEIPELSLVKADQAPTIDGELGDPVWAKAVGTGPFVSAVDGKPVPRSRVNGEAKLSWDERALYIAVTVYDPEPATAFSRDEIDPHIWSKASGIEVMLQPGQRNDNRDYFEIQIDVGEAVWDTRFDDYNRPISGPKDARRFGHQDWQGQVDRRVKIHQGSHYVVEAALPWEAFESAGAKRPKAGESWRLNLYSFRDGQRDSLAWSPILGKGNFHRSSRFGRIRF